MLRLTLSLTFLLFITPLAKAEQYTLLVFERSAELAKRTDTGNRGREYWQQYADFGRSLANAGVLKGGAALHPVEVLGVGDARLGGYFIIETSTLAEAERWAAQAPASRAGGWVIVATALPSPAMATP